MQAGIYGGGIHQLISVLAQALTSIGARPEPLDVERIAIMIHKIMSGQGRQFHTLEHIFGFIGKGDAILDLAAVFHDLVYFQVDAGFQKEMLPYMEPYIEHKGSELKLCPDVPADDRCFHITRSIFGMEHGQVLQTTGGLNEFLSAIMAFGLLKRWLPLDNLVEVAIAIEATIPFRGRDEQGVGPFERLETRLESLRNNGSLPWDPGRIEAAIRRALDMSNIDVGDFAMEATDAFLSNTWKLLPELNSSLRQQGSYSIADYRISLHKMEGFFRFLKPENVFHQWRGSPDDAQFSVLVSRVATNLQRGREYLQAKMLATGLLEAIAELSGGEAPISLFMGEIPQGGQKVMRLEDFLPKEPRPSWIKQDSAVWKLLKDGRLNKSSFDLQHSPLALFLYQRLDPGKFTHQVQCAREYFEGKRDALTFWQGMDPGICADMGYACAQMVESRRGILLTLADLSKKIL